MLEPSRTGRRGRGRSNSVNDESADQFVGADRPPRRGSLALPPVGRKRGRIPAASAFLGRQLGSAAHSGPLISTGLECVPRARTRAFRAHARALEVRTGRPRPLELGDNEPVDELEATDRALCCCPIPFGAVALKVRFCPSRLALLRRELRLCGCIAPGIAYSTANPRRQGLTMACGNPHEAPPAASSAAEHALRAAGAGKQRSQNIGSRTVMPALG